MACGHISTEQHTHSTTANYRLKMRTAKPAKLAERDESTKLLIDKCKHVERQNRSYAKIKVIKREQQIGVSEKNQQ